jgi:hypothetical protein
MRCGGAAQVNFVVDDSEARRLVEIGVVDALDETRQRGLRGLASCHTVSESHRWVPEALGVGAGGARGHGTWDMASLCGGCE